MGVEAGLGSPSFLCCQLRPGGRGRGCGGLRRVRLPLAVPGNDLGRVLRWGPGYSGEDPLSVLVSVDEADAVLVDRWTILLDAHEAGGAENGVADLEPPKVRRAGREWWPGAPRVTIPGHPL